MTRGLSEAERRHRAARVAEARDRLGKTQDEIAAAAGVSKRAYQSWELGEHVPQTAKLLKAEKALGLDYSAGQPPDLNAVDADIFPVLVAMATRLARYSRQERAVIMAGLWEYMSERTGPNDPK